MNIVSTPDTLTIKHNLQINASTPIKRVLSAAAALDFASIATTASGDLTIAVPGALVGDAVAIGLPAAPTAGLVFMGFVSAADVVTVRAMNITASPIDAASATYRVTVFAF
jgi:hypothetical protein